LVTLFTAEVIPLAIDLTRQPSMTLYLALGFPEVGAAIEGDGFFVAAIVADAHDLAFAVDNTPFNGLAHWLTSLGHFNPKSFAFTLTILPSG
jgi:hypothetical protein